MATVVSTVKIMVGLMVTTSGMMLAVVMPMVAMTMVMPMMLPLSPINFYRRVRICAWLRLCTHSLFALLWDLSALWENKGWRSAVPH